MISLKQKALDVTLSFKVALDGPAASGKGVIGNILAKEFSLLYLQSSIVYRSLAFLSVKKNVDPTNHNEIIDLSSKHLEIKEIIESVNKKSSNIDLTTEKISRISSIVASIPEVRNNLNQHLNLIIKKTNRLLIEGRDIGTVIMPSADLKIFITADVSIRANRRFRQLQSAGKPCILKDILNQIVERDLRDTERSSAPLLPANDALIIDTSKLGVKEVIGKIRDYIIVS